MNKKTPVASGMDHDWYGFRKLPETAFIPRKPTVQVMLIVVLQHFHLDRPPVFAVPGALDRPYPDIGNFTQRQVGQTDGLWRIAEIIDEFALPATFVVECDALPHLQGCQTLLRNPRHSIVAGGEHATALHTSALTELEERNSIHRTLQTLSQALTRQVDGWRSPYNAQSFHTMDLLASAGIRYVGDFANDDRPFSIDTRRGVLMSIPMNHFYSDLHFLHTCRQPLDDYLQSTLAAISVLARENTPSANTFPLVIHPWLMGVPHRVSHFAALLRRIKDLPDVQLVNSDQVYRSSAPLLDGGTA